MPRLSPLALALSSLLAATPALAQDAGKDARTLDTLIVTGTRVADRTVAESQSPIDIITPETLETTGTTELATALARARPWPTAPAACARRSCAACRRTRC